MKTDSTLTSVSRARRPSPRTRSRSGAPRTRSEPLPLLVAMASEGTVLDSMRAKHEGCFIPEFARRFGDPCDEAMLTETWRFVGLESRHRGSNRFKALAIALRMAAKHPRARARNRREEAVAAALEAWLASEPAPSRSRLELALAARKVDPSLRRVLAWAVETDELVAGLPPAKPFRGAQRALSLLAGSEISVVSAEPAGEVSREWDEAGIGHYPARIVGLERGPKASSLAALMEGGRFAGRALVVGGSPSDLEAARANGAAFYPIVPGREEESWRTFAEDFIESFRAGADRGAVGGVARSSNAPIAAFLTSLPLCPPWVSVTW